MSVRVKLPRMQQLERMVRDFAGGRYNLRVEGLTTPSANKVRWLRETGRWILEPADALSKAAARFGQQAIKTGIVRGNLNSVSLLEAMARGIRGQVLLRMTSGTGNDVRFAPLSASWAQRKRRLGLDPRITIATSALLNNLRRARWSLRRVR
jgi:hypothetical protein